MIKDFNEKMGEVLNFDELMRLTSTSDNYPKGLNLVSENGSRGSMFESWFENEFKDGLKLEGKSGVFNLEGKKSGLFNNPLTHTQDVFVIDCHYLDNGLVVGIELKHIDGILSGDPLKQLRRYADIIKNKNANIPLIRIEYVFSKESTALANKQLIETIFNPKDEINIRGFLYEIYYIDAQGVSRILK